MLVFFGNFGYAFGDFALQLRLTTGDSHLLPSFNLSPKIGSKAQFVQQKGSEIQNWVGGDRGANPSKVEKCRSCLSLGLCFLLTWGKGTDSSLQLLPVGWDLAQMPLLT